MDICYDMLWLFCVHEDIVFYMCDWYILYEIIAVDRYFSSFGLDICCVLLGTYEPYDVIQINGTSMKPT